MTKFSQFDPKRLYFVPLGGSGEIGMNLNVYAFGGKLLVVDTGVTFEKLPGIEVVMADVSWLRAQKKHIAGIVITHAHEDHVGAAGHLWKDLEAPIYVTPFTAGLLHHKLKEAKVRAPVHKVPLSSDIAIGPFQIGWISLTHSIPEPSALAIRTEAGIVVHTGDWKLDDHPVVGEQANTEALQALGKAGVLALVCDSTCVFEPEWSGSEKSVQDFLVQHIAGYSKGRVVVACFASNIARLMSCFKAAEASGRRVVLAGRSLERMDAIARETGYFDKVPPFLSGKEAKGLKREKALIVATGSQGEPRAALRRMAEGHHPFVTLEAGDTVLFSSRIIPGNEKEIYALQNQLALKDVRVVTPKEHPELHVSGHPSAQELKQMYAWVKPKIAIPVHGEARHLIKHAALAKEWKAKSFPPKNGDVIALDPVKGPQKVGEVPVGRVGLDGNYLVSLKDSVFAERSRLAASGVISVGVVMKHQNVQDVSLHMQGVVSSQHAQSWYEELAGIVRRALDHAPASVREDEGATRDVVAQEVQAFCFHERQKKPSVFVHVAQA